MCVCVCVCVLQSYTRPSARMAGDVWPSGPTDSHAPPSSPGGGVGAGGDSGGLRCEESSPFCILFASFPPTSTCGRTVYMSSPDSTLRLSRYVLIRPQERVA